MTIPAKETTRDPAARLAEVLARRLGEARYKLWFDRNTRFAFSEGALTVEVPNRHFQEWLEKTFGRAVASAAEEVLGSPVPVAFRIAPEAFTAPGPTLASPSEEPAPAAPAKPGKAGKAGKAKKPAGPELPFTQGKVVPPEATALPIPRDRGKRTRVWRRLADFIVGPCNRVAHASALSVIEAPGECANPLVFYGPVGTGKTHLLEGIYGGLRRARPDWRVTYITSEDFTNRFVQAVRGGKLHGFRRTFRDCDALLVDDLHFLATKKATQEEFLHTFDTLLSDGRQVVLTCDCHPRLADDFTPELTDRLLGGAVWSLSPPDADTRLAILRARSASTPGPTLPEPVLHFLAGQLRGNVRELEGALQSVRHFSRVTGRPIDLQLVREALADLLRHAVRVVQLADVDRVVCANLRLASGTLQGKGRAWAVSHPRMVAMFLARKHTASAYSEIGSYFGGRNHSTVVAAEKKVRAWLEADEELSLGERRVRVRELVERVERDLLR